MPPGMPPPPGAVVVTFLCSTRSGCFGFQEAFSTSSPIFFRLERSSGMTQRIRLLVAAGAPIIMPMPISGPIIPGVPPIMPISGPIMPMPIIWVALRASLGICAPGSRASLAGTSRTIQTALLPSAHPALMILSEPRVE